MKMPEFRGFRADRLREAMEENGAAFEDICETLREVKKGFFIKDFKYRLLDITDGCIEPTNEELYAICYTVGCSADYLLGLSDEMY